MKRKNKIEIFDKIMSDDAKLQMYYYPYWGDDDDYYPDYYDRSDYSSWEYLPSSNDSSLLLHSYRGGCKTINKSPNIGNMIDMNTIYTKYIIRERKINQLLGIENNISYKNTMAEYFPKKNYLNEDRDI